MFAVAFARDAEDDVVRLFESLVERADTVARLALAAEAVAAIRAGIDRLTEHPFLYRKHDEDPLLRELLIPFGTGGYVALYHILDSSRVLVVAVRHQLEDDYH